jgi:hypothetical protein
VVGLGVVDLGVVGLEVVDQLGVVGLGLCLGLIVVVVGLGFLHLLNPYRRLVAVLIVPVPIAAAQHVGG